MTDLPRAFRQGDVLFIPRELPTKVTGREEPEQGRLILARGEVTGHAHVVDAMDAELVVAEAERYLKVLSATTTVRHEEHGPIVLPQLPDGYGWYLPRQVEVVGQQMRLVGD